MAKDNRYTLRREFCGQQSLRWVARWCGEWLGQGKTRAEAARLCSQHQAARTLKLMQWAVAA